MARPTRRRGTAISPSKGNLKALESRLRTTFSPICRSTNAGSARGGQSTAKVSPAFSQAERKLLARSAVNSPRSARRSPNPPGLDPGEVKQAVDEPLETQPVSVDDFQPLPLRRRQRPVRTG